MAVARAKLAGRISRDTDTGAKCLIGTSFETCCYLGDTLHALASAATDLGLLSSGPWPVNSHSDISSGTCCGDIR